MHKLSYVKQWVIGHKVNRSVWCPSAVLVLCVLTLVLTACGTSTISSTDNNTAAEAAVATATTVQQFSAATSSPSSNNPTTSTRPDSTTTQKIGTITSYSTPTPHTVTSIDWVHFVKLGGITYITSINDQDLKVEIGPEFAQVKFQLNGNVNDPQYQIKDGDAAFLDVGTPIYTVKEYKPEFRLAVRESDNKWHLYEADTNPNAKVGADLLDIGGKVQYIGINSATDGTTELAAIKDTKQIASLVDTILRSPVDQNLMPASNISYFIAFHLQDGTVVNRAYWPDTDELARGIILPKAFDTVIEQAIKAGSSATVAAPIFTYLQSGLVTQTAPNVSTKPIAKNSPSPTLPPISTLTTTFKGDNFITITDSK